MNIEVNEGRLYELQCKCYALADMFGSLGIEDGLYKDTPYGLYLIMSDLAWELEQIQEGGGKVQRAAAQNET
jgi:predicted enzyme related to lactoylglutathione lyase